MDDSIKIVTFDADNLTLETYDSSVDEGEFTLVGTSDKTMTKKAKKATFTISVSSTGKPNTSAFALVDASGNVIAAATGLIEVTGTKAITATYTVKAGTYKIVSPQSSYGRGYRLMSVVVVDGIK